MTLQEIYNYFTSRYKILLCRIKALEDAPSGGADGNGIYDGSGNVPDNTVTTLDGSFQIIGTGADREFYVEVGDGVSDLTLLDMAPTSMTIGYDGTSTSTIILDSGGVDVNNIHKLALNPTPADLDYSGQTATFLANENQGFGDAVFINSTSEAQLGDASVIATASCIGLCIAGVTTGNTGTYLLQGFARNDTWNWTPGQPIYLSLTGTTTNTLTQTAPSATNEVVQILGMAITADIIYWNPNLVQIENA